MKRERERTTTIKQCPDIILMNLLFYRPKQYERKKKKYSHIILMDLPFCPSNKQIESKKKKKKKRRRRRNLSTH